MTTRLVVGAAMTQTLQLLALAAQVRGQLFVDVVKHAGGAGHATIEQRAVAFGLLLRGGHLGLQLLLRLHMAFV